MPQRRVSNYMRFQITILLFHQTTDSDLTDDERSDEGTFCFLEILAKVLKVYFCLLETCSINYSESKTCLFVFSSCITECETVSNDSSDEPGNDNGNNFSVKTYHNICN